MKRLISLGMPHDWRFNFSLFIAVLQGLSAVALLGVSAWLIARASEMPSMMYLSLAIVGVRTFALARASLRYAERWLSHDAVLASGGDLRARVFSSLIHLVPAGKPVNLGELSARVINDVDELPNLSLRVVLPLVQSVSVSVISVGLFAFILPSAALPLAVALLIAFILALPVAARISTAADKNSAKERSELIAISRSTVAGAPLLASYQWEGQLLKQIEVVQERIAAANLKTAKALGLGQAAFAFLAQTSAVLSAVLGLQQLHQIGSTSLVMLAVYALLPLGVFDVASVATNLTSVWRRYRAAAERINELLDTARSQSVGLESPAPGSPVAGAFAPATIRSLALQDASLGYSRPLLEGVNLKLTAGKVTALVGASGDGKTTIGLALAGFIEPTSGNLMVNGVTADSLGLTGEQGGALLRTRVGYLEQSPSILAGNVRQNLKLAAQNASDEKLIDVLRRVQLWSMFEAREGLDTQLGERGVLISGGEAQRLSLARALLADFDAIILDEPSANLSERQSLELVGELLQAARDADKAILLITHQGRLAKLADEIYAIE